MGAQPLPLQGARKHPRGPRSAALFPPAALDSNYQLRETALQDRDRQLPQDSHLGRVKPI